MLGDRRKNPRIAINRVGRIQMDEGPAAASRTSCECTITDISEQGARLFVDSCDVTDRFYLLIIGDVPVRHECRVAWRLGGELGVEFTSASSERWRHAAERIRDDARKVFHTAR